MDSFDATRARCEAATKGPCNEDCPHRDECMPRYFDTQDCITAWKGTGLTPTEAVVLKEDVKRLTAELAAMTDGMNGWRAQAETALADNDRLTAALADVTAERDALSSRVSYECAAKNAFDIRWLVENRKYNKSVVHLQRARAQRDGWRAQAASSQADADQTAAKLQAMTTKYKDALSDYGTAVTMLAERAQDLAAMTEDRDAWQRRAEAAESWYSRRFDVRSVPMRMKRSGLASSGTNARQL